MSVKLKHKAAAVVVKEEVETEIQHDDSLVVSELANLTFPFLRAGQVGTFKKKHHSNRASYGSVFNISIHNCERETSRFRLTAR
jgi:hypothetical protein